ncbi:MAG: U32 family peptidase [Bradyrhizobiaceae bacterium]|nr:MAG: U32 family peptidase [Bradyrhizobiaceae bacterium]
MQLTLGPVLFNWPTEAWQDFYARIADEADVDRVIVGEVVCSKRMPFRDHAIAAVLERLARAGKEVVYATLALPTLPRETRAIREAIEAGYPVEANDIATVHLLAGAPHVVGPYLNIYNEAALAAHAALGATRVCLSPELPLAAIEGLAARAGAVALEVFAFGRAPLALSARCYHARAHGLPKDACQFVCERDADGMDVATVTGQPFLAVNGIQTLGHGVTAAIRQVDALRAAGVDALRLSPQSCDMVAVARVFRGLAEARIDAAAAEAALAALPLPGPLGDGYLRGLPGARRLQDAE